MENAEIDKKCVCDRCGRPLSQRFIKERQARRLARTGRVICGALTQKGTRCQAKSEPFQRHCKRHGGQEVAPGLVKKRRASRMGDS